MFTNKLKRVLMST